jgi:FlgN protein.
MNDALEKLIQALREELQQYGEMLARLDLQQEHAISRRSEDLLQATAEIEVQSQVIKSARQARIECQAAVAEALGLASDATFADLIPLLPADYRPLVSALVQENNESLGRIHQRSRQNHILLCRSLELMSRLLGNLMPGTHNPVYTDKMNVSNGAFPAHAVYQAIG